MTTIPFFPPDLFAEDREVILQIVSDIGTSESQRFILGARTARLEEELRSRTGASHVVACASGTAGLTLAIDALGVEPGDEVIVPAFCCQPVASVVVARGATPVFADVDRRTLVLDPASVESLISPATKVIMPAHVFSVMADMRTLRTLATERGLRLLEDAAVAQGASLDGRPAGRWGDIGVFSFFQVKALGTIGEGGVVITDDEELAMTCRMLRNHGQGAERFVHHRVGYNLRLDEIIAAFQLHRLPRFEERLERRASIADYYTHRFQPLEECGVLAPPAGREGRCYYVYSLLVERREDLRSYLASRGIGSHVYYPVPLPLQPAFAKWARADHDYSGAELVSSRNLAIPIYPHLSDGEVQLVADTVCDFFT